MSRPAAPQMPTQKQVREAYEAVRELFPDARIIGVGPDGVRFEYPTAASGPDKWKGRPFSADGA